MALYTVFLEKWRNSDETLVRTITWTYDDAGRLKTAEDPNSKYTYSYDLGDMVTSVDNLGTPGVPNVVLNYAYDYAGNRTLLTDNLNHSISYTYADHRLDTMSLLSGIDTVATVDFDYDSIGRLSAINRLAGTWEPIKTAFSYDNADRLKQIKHTRETQTPTTLSQFDYTYDVASQLKTLNVTGTSLWSESLTYGYDNIGQLTSVTGTRNGQAVSGETYSFDVNGNRTNFTTTAGNRVTFDGQYSYEHDDEGNTTRKYKTGEHWYYTWDHRNRLIEVVLRDLPFNDPLSQIQKKVNYTYDVDNRRIGVLEDADGAGAGAAVQRWTVFDGDNIYADFNGSGTLQYRYLYGPAMDEIYARIGAGDNVDWYLTDHLGSVRQLVDTDGTVLKGMTYDSWGKILNQTETNPNDKDRFKFTAREWDALVNLQYNRGRYLDVALARWLSEDPIGFGGGDTNLYRYVGNGPTGAADPTGMYIFFYSLESAQRWAQALGTWYGDGTPVTVVQVGNNPPIYALFTNAVLRERIEADTTQPGWTRAVAAAIGSSTNHLLGRSQDGWLSYTPASDNPTFTRAAERVRNLHRYENAMADRWGNVVPSRGTAEDCQYQHDQFQQDVNQRGWWRVQADIWLLPGGGFDIVVGAAGGFTGVPGLGPNRPGQRTVAAAAAPSRPRPSIPHPGNIPSTQAPGAGWVWRGQPPAGGRQGNWFNPTTGESLSNDMNNAFHGPHWDYRIQGVRGKWRWYPDGRLEYQP